MVATVTAIFKTLIPQGKSRSQREKTLKNKGLTFAVYKSYIKPIKTYKIPVCSYMFSVFLIFVYDLSYVFIRKSDSFCSSSGQFEGLYRLHWDLQTAI